MKLSPEINARKEKGLPPFRTMRPRNRLTLSRSVTLQRVHLADTILEALAHHVIEGLILTTRETSAWNKIQKVGSVLLDQMKMMVKKLLINVLDIEMKIVIILVAEEGAITRSTVLIPDAMLTRVLVKTIDARRVVMMIVGAIGGKDLLIEFLVKRIKPNRKRLTRRILIRHRKSFWSLNQ